MIGGATVAAVGLIVPIEREVDSPDMAFAAGMSIVMLLPGAVVGGGVLGALALILARTVFLHTEDAESIAWANCQMLEEGAPRVPRD